MSKTWVVPADTEQRIEKLHVAHAAIVTPGARIAELRMIRFQGMEVPEDIPAVPLSAAAPGRVLFFPDVSVGTVVREGTKVFSILSAEDWSDLGTTAGEEVRARMVSWPVRMSREDFEERLNAMTQAAVRRLIDKIRR